MRYRGQLHVEDQTASVGLPVEIVLMDTRLAVHSGGETIGRYALADISVERLGGDRFRLDIGSESLVFVADDALGFSYDALPFISAGGSHPTSTGLRRLAHRLLRRTDEQPPAAPRDPVAEPWTEAPTEISPVASTEVSTQPPQEQPAGQSGEPTQVRLDRDRTDDHADGGGPPDDRPPPTAPVIRRCAGTMSDGSPCPMVPGAGSSLCHTHAARLDRQRDDLHRRRDRAAAAAGSGITLPDLDDVLGRLEKAVAQVHDGALAPQQAQAMASLVQAMIETIELSDAAERRSRA